MQTLTSRRKLPPAACPNRLPASSHTVHEQPFLLSSVAPLAISLQGRAVVSHRGTYSSHVGEVKSPRATEHSGDVASGWSHTTLSTRKSDRDLASGVREAGGADHSSDSHCFLLSLEESARLRVTLTHLHL